MEPLTALERKFVILVAQGHPNRAIAKELCLGKQTVRNYLSVIYAKVGVKNRAGLTNWAWRTGLVEKPSDHED